MAKSSGIYLTSPSKKGYTFASSAAHRTKDFGCFPTRSNSRQVAFLFPIGTICFDLSWYPFCVAVSEIACSNRAESLVPLNVSVPCLRLKKLIWLNGTSNRGAPNESFHTV